MDFETKEEALQFFIDTVKDYFVQVQKVCRRRESRLGITGLKDSQIMNIASNILFVAKTPEEIAKIYVKFILPHAKQIEKRDEKFFLENDHIYPGISADKVQFFKDLWINKDGHGFTPDEKEISFEFFDVMLDAIRFWST